MNKIRTTVLLETDIAKIRAIVRPSLHNRYVRGQSKSSYDLSSSFFRKHTQVYSQKSTKWIFCRDYFSPYEWKEQVKGEYHKGDDDSPLRTTFPIGIGKHGENLEMFPHLIGMAIQQHHGELPTPLLDVSYDIEMPLYCACRTNWDWEAKVVSDVDWGGTYLFPKKYFDDVWKDFKNCRFMKTPQKSKN